METSFTKPHFNDIIRCYIFTNPVDNSIISHLYRRPSLVQLVPSARLMHMKKRKPKLSFVETTFLLLILFHLYWMFVQSLTYYFCCTLRRGGPIKSSPYASIFRQCPTIFHLFPPAHFPNTCPLSKHLPNSGAAWFSLRARDL